MTYIKTEYDIQQKIASILENFVEKGVKFNGVSIASVKINYEVEYGERKRYADIAVFKDDGYPLIIIETKKKYEKGSSFKAERRFHVTSEEVVGQVFSYVVILKFKGIHVPFVATANDRQIAIFQVPEDIDKHVNWEAIKQRDYGLVLSLDYIYGILRTKYMLLHKPIRFEEGFFAELLEILTGLYIQKYKLEDIKQELSWILIEDFRGFVDTLAPFVLDAIAPNGKYSKQWAERVEDYAKTRGYNPSPEQLAREMAYVLLNKILFYKVLERYYKGLTKLEPLYSKGEVKTVSEYLKRLNELFEKAIEVTGDFEPVFRADIYDYIECIESTEVLKLLDWLINFIDRYRVEKLGDIIGYVYEELIPAEERHQLGQFYTPKPIAELIVKWCIRSPDDKILDPGCGSGTFLIEAYKRLAELKLKKPFSEIKYVPSDVHQQILSQLYGVDINEFPAHLTAVNLAMRNPRAPSNITNIVVRDYFTITPGQSVLVPYEVKTAKGEEYVLIDFKDFDAVVGNPPYTRRTQIPNNIIQNIKQSVGKVLNKYNISLGILSEVGIHVPWIMHSEKFLKEGGRLGMIIEDTWLHTMYGVNFVNFLLDHFKVKAVIEFARRLFDIPVVATCVILLEKCSSLVDRENNEIVFMYVDKEASVTTILEAISNPGKYKNTFMIRTVKQEEARNKRWIELLFDIGNIKDKLLHSNLLIPVTKYFNVRYGNIVGVSSRGGTGGDEFFYVDENKVKTYGLHQYIKPLISDPKRSPYFSFSLRDWNELIKGKEKSYVFICHKPLDDLPEGVKKYIEWGERTPLVKPKKGVARPASQSMASQNRARSRQFYGWYDLGNLIYAPIAYVRRARYWNRAIYIKDDYKNPSIALDEGAFLALIPKTEFSEEELKAFVAFLNSSLTQLMSEILGIVAGGVGAGGLDAKSMENKLLVINVKKLSEELVRRFAQLFDKLDAEARRLGGADEVENVFGSELAKELTKKKKIKANVDGLFNTVIKEIDYEVGRILGFTEAEIEAVRGLVIELAKRRLGRAGEAKPTAIKGEEKVELVKPKKTRKTEEKKSPHKRLDEWVKK